MQKPHVEVHGSFPFKVTKTTYIPDSGQSWKDFSKEVKAAAPDCEYEVCNFGGQICLRVTVSVRDFAYFEQKTREKEDYNLSTGKQRKK
jgi:hypothetical protein